MNKTLLLAFTVLCILLAGGITILLTNDNNQLLLLGLTTLNVLIGYLLAKLEGHTIFTR